MVITIQGVRHSGERVTGANVTPDSRRRIQMQLGEDVIIRAHLVEQSGVPIDLTVGDPVVKMTVRDRPGQFGDKKFEKTAVVKPLLGPGWCEMVILVQDTKQLDGLGTRYLWDLWITQDGLRDCLVPISPFIVAPSVQIP